MAMKPRKMKRGGTPTTEDKKKTGMMRGGMVKKPTGMMRGGMAKKSTGMMRGGMVAKKK